MDEFLTVFGPARVLGLEQILCSVLMSFVLCTLVTSAYRWTAETLTYSRSFIQAMVLSGVITCVIILAIGNNLARGLGILGTLALIRFRSHIRDPRDITFLFATLAIGIATGATVFSVAIVGTLAFCGIALYLHYSPYSSRREYEGLLRFVAPTGAGLQGSLDRIFEEFCSQVQLIALRDAIQGEGVEHAYQVRLRDPSCRQDLIEAIRELPTVDNVSILMQRSTVEI